MKAASSADGFTSSRSDLSAAALFASNVAPSRCLTLADQSCKMTGDTTLMIVVASILFFRVQVTDDNA